MGCCCRATCQCGASGSSSYGSTMSVNISGLSVPSSCLQYQWSYTCYGATGVALLFKFTSIPFPGTFCLTKESGVCRWSTTVACTVDTLMGPYSDFCRVDNFVIGDGCNFSSSGCSYAQYNQLRIEAYTSWSSPTAGMVKVYAYIKDASDAYQALIASEHSGATGVNPFTLIDTTFATMDCAGTATPTNAAKWWDRYEVGYFSEPGIGCHPFSRISPTDGNAFGGTIVVADTAC